MSVETPGNHIILGNSVIEIGTSLPRADAAHIAEYSGQLIVARFLDENGEPAQRVASMRYGKYPTLPVKPPARADTTIQQVYEKAVDVHIRAVDNFVAAARDKTLEPFPPIIGNIDISAANPDYFSVNCLNGITSILPYARDDRQPYNYLIYTAHSHSLD
jgi:hypothetical protein